MTKEQILDRQQAIMSEYSVSELMQADTIKLETQARQMAVRQLETEELETSTIETLERKGHLSLDSYLSDLDDMNGLENGTARELYSMLGETELFDGIVSSLEDYSDILG